MLALLRDASMAHYACHPSDLRLPTSDLYFGASFSRTVHLPLLSPRLPQASRQRR